nr:hypothetical protein [Tanacetum cinerariifolium]
MYDATVFSLSINVDDFVKKDDLKTKHPFEVAPSLPNIPIDHHQLVAPPGFVLDMIKSFPHGTSCGRDELRAQHLMDCLSGAVVAISDELIASITQVVNLFLDGKCPKTLGEYTASAPLTPLVKPGGGIRHIVVSTVWRRLVSKVSATMIGHSLDTYLNDLQFDFKNSFNLVDREVMLQEVHTHCPAISRWLEFCYSNPARLYYGEHTLWSHQGVQQGDPLGPLLFALVLHPLICKIKDSFNLSFHAWYLDDDTIIRDTLVVGKVLELIIEDGLRRGLHLNIDKTEVFWPKEDPRSRLVGVFPHAIARPLHGVKLLGGPAQHSFDAALCSFLEHIVTTSGAGFGDWQLRLATLQFSYGWLAFNVKMKIDLLCNPSEIAAPKLMKKLADTYFTSVTQMDESTFFLSPRQMALWKSQMEDHTSDWLRVVSISRLGQTMNVFSLLQDLYGDHAVSCAEVDIGLEGGRDKSLRPADVLLYSWDCGRALCVDLIGSSPLTQTGMVDFAPSRAVVDAAQRKRGRRG